MTVWLPSWQKDYNIDQILLRHIYIYSQVKFTQELCLPAWSFYVYRFAYNFMKLFRIPLSFNWRYIQMIKRFTFLAILAVLPLITFNTDANANNLLIENVELVDQDETADTIKVQFDISWDNAWADTTNLDGVWIVLRLVDATNSNMAGTLRTAGLNPDGEVGTKQSGSEIGQIDIVVPDDRKGAFIVPGVFDTGTVDFHDVYVTWHYGEDGFSDTVVDDSTFDVNVVGVEVVYIHEGAFTAGNDGTGTTASFKQNWSGTDNNTAPTVSSEDMISFRGSSAGTQYWYYQTGSNTNESAAGATFDLPKAFPKGYQGFFMMKTEISYGLYNTTFYDNLTTNQRASRNAGTGGTGTQDPIAVIDIEWEDLCAFCDWMALRPMTELEFEKAARGPTAEVAGEFAWGSSSATVCLAVTNQGATNEACSTGSAQVHIATGSPAMSYPLRPGIFATGSTTTRATSGAGYWGNLDLSGNVAEMVVSVGNANGRLFAGTHGDGTLTTLASYEGNATNSDWPGWDISNPTRGLDNANTAQGAGMRGGAFQDAGTGYARGWVSDRFDAADYVQITDGASGQEGGRCVRTAPTLFVSYFEDRN